MRKFFFCSLIILCFSFSTFAQYIENPQSSNKNTVFDAKQLIAPAILMTTGTLIHSFAHSTWDLTIHDRVIEWKGSRRNVWIDDVFEYVPITAFVGLSYLGVNSKHDHFDRTLYFHLALFPTIIVSRSLKMILNTPRPDTSDNLSFPSGHSVMTFMGAEMIRMEYGLAWGLGAYALACTTGFLRLYNNKHWFSDVLMGAGLGILGAHAGEWLLEPVKGWIDPLFKKNTTIATTIDPLSGIPCMALCYRF